MKFEIPAVFSAPCKSNSLCHRIDQGRAEKAGCNKLIELLPGRRESGLQGLICIGMSCVFLMLLLVIECGMDRHIPLAMGY